ncbi:hypothetical protein AB0K74_28725, partial [Streptomyces sp. NPDC056159]
GVVQNIRVIGTGQLLELSARLRRAGHENIRSIRVLRRVEACRRSRLPPADAASESGGRSPAGHRCSGKQ